MGIFSLKKNSLRTRIFLISTMFVIIVILFISGLMLMQSRLFWSAISKSNVEKNSIISQTMSDSVQHLGTVAFLSNVKSAASISDGEFWSVAHDLEIISLQAEMILKNMDDFDMVSVSPPREEYDGKTCFQVLYGPEVDADNFSLQEKIGKIGNMETLCRHVYEDSVEVIDSIVIAFPEGASIWMDASSGKRINEEGIVDTFDVERCPWYVGAITSEKSFFMPINEDIHDGTRQVSASIPVYVDGKLSAVVAISLNMERIEWIINESKLGNSVSSCLIDNTGVIICSDALEGEFVQGDGLVRNLLDSENMEIVEIANKVLAGESGFALINDGGKETYIAYAALPTVGWGQFLFVPSEQMYKSRDAILAKTDTVFAEMQETLNEQGEWFVFFVLIFGLLAMVGAGVVSLIFSYQLSKPIMDLNDAGQRYANSTNEDVSKGISYFDSVEVNTKDEIEMLWHTLMDMEDRVKTSVSYIRKISAEQERIAAELTLASNIQQNMLTKEFHPAMEKAGAFDIFAAMTPAKEVGGDFYDFLVVDDDHVAIAMADVSGKGVPAAMFMMMVKIFMDGFAGMGITPQEVVEKVNQSVCSYNDENMFVTIWFGILELSTGKVNAVNAGHEYPVIRGGDGKFRLMEDEHSFVVGAFMDMTYESYEFTLEKGDAIFLYTDGILDATNVDGVFFGNDRIIEALNETGLADTSEEILTHVKERVKGFVGDAPQFDDMTMLLLKYIR